MNTLLRRTAAPRLTHYALSRPAVSPLIFFKSRTVASSVSNRPASQTFEHTATNIKEEAGNAASDVAKIIAGTNVIRDDVPPNKSTFFGITGAIASSVPKPAMVFGLAGTLPYVGASATTVYLAQQAGHAASGVATKIDPGVALTILDQALNVQMTYGAVMLSFLGAIHWGMEFAGYGGQKGYSRLMLGTAPMLVAWPSLALDPMAALTTQWVGFTALWWADAKATSNGWAPAWYSQYRFYLSVLVGACIIGSLAGTSYYGPVAGHGFLSHDLELTRELRRELSPETKHKVPGVIEAAPAGQPGFVTIKKRDVDAEEKKN
ncbi:uncharacterized protein BT62DRAFT_1074774 [Guyanagaster necrorhizus]|uniref:Uncharacterized protein n=1 Tax=Guyanagaster necrorhizus TaxID=856835 RepID=A0A9P7VX10_9AGAR|nr:uncharacterized protein BT62DRAFT_1074774 [Guyanagaster necrorhizus MCA 3950]KAG7448285.1 hypothetical protein BT62DRAFT_1074774 [Guyanagaster necrorhizus MCA 3950]